MCVTRYNIRANVYPMMCVVQNKLIFTPKTQNSGKGGNSRMETEIPDSAVFSYPLHGGAMINKFVAKIIPTDPNLSKNEIEEKTRKIVAQIHEKDEAKRMFVQGGGSIRGKIFLRKARGKLFAKKV